MKLLSIKEFLLTEKLKSSLILYHGTENNFTEFNLSRFGESDDGWLGYGIYLTNNYEYAESYGKVLTCKINITNPYILTEYSYSIRPEKLCSDLDVSDSYQITKKLKSLGHDCVVLNYTEDDGEDFLEVCWFDPKNIEILP